MLKGLERKHNYRDIVCFKMFHFDKSYASYRKIANQLENCDEEQSSCCLFLLFDNHRVI